MPENTAPTSIMTAREAFATAQGKLNARLHAHGIAPLVGHDIPIIAAYSAFERRYDRVRAHLDDDKREQFNREVVGFALRCIADALGF